MLLIFGIRRLRKNFGMMPGRCDNCGQFGLALFRISTWFALFFIPVIPLSFSFRTACPNCRAVRDIDRHTADAMQQSSTSQTPVPTDSAGQTAPIPDVPGPTLPVPTRTGFGAPQSEAGSEPTAPLLVAATAAPTTGPGSRPAPGWYRDSNPALLRWWDGGSWTGHTMVTPG